MHSAAQLYGTEYHRHVTRRQVRREFAYGWMAVRGALARQVNLAVGFGMAALLLVAVALGAAVMMSLTGLSELTPEAQVSSAVSAPAPASVAPAPAAPTHQVAAGETLATIGQRYQVSYQAIAGLNQITNPHRIAPGQRLAIPAPAAVTQAPNAAIQAPATTVVSIAPNSTLSDIARAHRTTVAQLIALNPQLSDPNRIVAGAPLRVA